MIRNEKKSVDHDTKKLDLIHLRVHTDKYSTMQCTDYLHGVPIRVKKQNKRLQNSPVGVIGAVLSTHM